MVACWVSLDMSEIGIPQILIAWRSRIDRIQSREVIAELVIEQMTDLSAVNRRMIEALIRDPDEKIEALTQEIETLGAWPWHLTSKRKP